MDWDAFFMVHSDLPREGPGSDSDVAWACALASQTGLTGALRICDAGCGPGGDLAALRASLPDAQITAIDLHAPFVAQAAARSAADPQVDAQVGDLADLPGRPFDMIWCAGALYFLGLEGGLATMLAALRPGGVLAFSEPCHFTDSPSAQAIAMWDGYATSSRAQILNTAQAAGFEVLGARPLAPSAWEAYYKPMEERIAALRPGADARLTAMLDLCAQEARTWRAVQAETGYLLTVLRRG